MKLNFLAKLFIYSSPLVLLLLAFVFAFYKSPNSFTFQEENKEFEVFETQELLLGDTLEIELTASHRNLKSISTEVTVENYSDYFTLNIPDIHTHREELVAKMNPLEVRWALQENNTKLREGSVKIFPIASELGLNLDFDKIEDSKSKKYTLILEVIKEASLNNTKSDSVNIPVNFTRDYNLVKSYDVDLISFRPANYLLILKNLNVYFTNDYIVFLLIVFFAPYLYLLSKSKIFSKDSSIDYLNY
jgi:hypothetical protein